MITTLDNLKKEVYSIYNTNPVTEETFLEKRKFFLETNIKSTTELINKFLNRETSVLFLVKDNQDERLSEVFIGGRVNKHKYIYSNSKDKSYYLEIGEICYDYKSDEDSKMFGNLSNVRYKPLQKFYHAREEEGPSLSELLLWIDLETGDMERITLEEYIVICNLVTAVKPECKNLLEIKDHNRI